MELSGRLYGPDNISPGVKYSERRHVGLKGFDWCVWGGEIAKVDKQ